MGISGKYGGNARNLWRRVYGYTNHKPVVVEFVDPVTNLSSSLDLNKTYKSGGVYEIEGYVAPSDDNSGPTPPAPLLPDGFVRPFNETQTGTSELHIGSFYLTAGQTLAAETGALFGTLGGGTASINIRRFTNGGLLCTLNASGVGLSAVDLGSPIGILTSDYYDIFLFGDDPSTISIMKSLRLVVE